jgi:hypothetical protein
MQRPPPSAAGPHTVKTVAPCPLAGDHRPVPQEPYTTMPRHCYTRIRVYPATMICSGEHLVLSTGIRVRLTRMPRRDLTRISA